MPEPTGAAWGVDGCKAGWFFFKLSGCPAIVEEYGIRTTFKDIVDDAADNDLVLVDIPIGLPDLADQDGRARETAFRTCDEQARGKLGNRKSSVFPVPVREVMEALRHCMGLGVRPRNDEEKKKRRWSEVRRILNDRELSVAKGEGRITAQSFAILPKIVEADDLLRGNAKARKIVRETHPEVCFHALVGDDRKERLETFSKKHGLGFLNRVTILESCHRGAKSAIFNACEEWSKIASDDIVDAMACAVTARIILNEPGARRPLRYDSPKDKKGLPMQIVYACRDDARRVLGS